MIISGDVGFYFGRTLVTYYGLCIACGILAAGLLGVRLLKKEGLAVDTAICASGICGIGALLGAKLLYLAITIPQLDNDLLSKPSTWTALMQGGFVFYGGLIGAIISVPVAGHLLNIDSFRYLNVLSPCIPLGHAFGRIGCLLVGCCYGGPTNGTFSVTYTDSAIAPNGVPLLPIQLIESICCIFISAVLVFYSIKSNSKSGFALYCCLYAAFRFALEFFRYDNLERGFFWTLSTSQWISLFIVIAVALYKLFESFSNEANRETL